MSPAKSITQLLVGLGCPWRFSATNPCPTWINKALTGAKGPTALPVDTTSAKKYLRLCFSGMLRAMLPISIFLAPFNPSFPSQTKIAVRVLTEASAETTPVPIWTGGKFHVLLCRYCHVFIDSSPVELRGNICGTG